MRYRQLRRLVVVGDGAGRRSAAGQRRVHRRAQRHRELLVRLVQRVVHDRHRHRPGQRLPRLEGQCAACRRVVGPGRRRQVRGRVAHRHRVSARPIEAHREPHEPLVGALAQAPRRYPQLRRRVVVVVNRSGRHGGIPPAGQHRVPRVRQRHGELFVRFVERVVGHRDLDHLRRRRTARKHQLPARRSVVRCRRRRVPGRAGRVVHGHLGVVRQAQAHRESQVAGALHRTRARDRQRRDVVLDDRHLHYRLGRARVVSAARHVRQRHRRVRQGVVVLRRTHRHRLLRPPADRREYQFHRVYRYLRRRGHRHRHRRRRPRAEHHRIAGSATFAHVQRRRLHRHGTHVVVVDRPRRRGHRQRCALRVAEPYREGLGALVDRVVAHRDHDGPRRRGERRERQSSTCRRIIGAGRRGAVFGRIPHHYRFAGGAAQAHRKRQRAVALQRAHARNRQRRQLVRLFRHARFILGRLDRLLLRRLVRLAARLPRRLHVRHVAGSCRNQRSQQERRQRQPLPGSTQGPAAGHPHRGVRHFIRHRSALRTRTRRRHPRRRFSVVPGFGPAIGSWCPSLHGLPANGAVQRDAHVRRDAFDADTLATVGLQAQAERRPEADPATQPVGAVATLVQREAGVRGHHRVACAQAVADLGIKTPVGDDPASPAYIVNERGVGYRMARPSDP